MFLKRLPPFTWLMCNALLVSLNADFRIMFGTDIELLAAIAAWAVDMLKKKPSFAME